MPSHRISIIGYPIGHSVSPIFQQAALDYYSIDAVYEAWETTEDQLETNIRKLNGPDFLGANVTVPYKEACIAHLDDLMEWASFMGSVNVIAKRDTKLVGYNTDSYAFLKALREEGKFEPKETSVLLLGAGGVARTIAITLERNGISSLAIANRTRSRAETIANIVAPWISRVKVIDLNSNEMKQEALNSHLIVNCTTLGMSGTQQADNSILSADSIRPETLVYDLVYNPLETPLLQEANKAGARTLGGLHMLIYQGAAAFELWTGKEPPIDVMFEAAQKALGANK